MAALDGLEPSDRRHVNTEEDKKQRSDILYCIGAGARAGSIKGDDHRKRADKDDDESGEQYRPQVAPQISVDRQRVKQPFLGNVGVVGLGQSKRAPQPPTKRYHRDTGNHASETSEKGGPAARRHCVAKVGGSYVLGVTFDGRRERARNRGGGGGGGGGGVKSLRINGLRTETARSIGRTASGPIGATVTGFGALKCGSRPIMVATIAQFSALPSAQKIPARAQGSSSWFAAGGGENDGGGTTLRRLPDGVGGDVVP